MWYSYPMNETIKFRDALGREKTAQAGQEVPAGAVLLEGGKWRTLTAPETVRKLIVQGNPYEDEDDKSVLVCMTDGAWDAHNASKVSPVPKAGTFEAAMEAARAAVALRGAAPEGKRWVINPTVFPKAEDFLYADWRGGKMGLRIEAQVIPPAAKPAESATSSYREQGDPRYPGKFDGQKAAREWAEDAYRCGDSWSDD